MTPRIRPMTVFGSSDVLWIKAYSNQKGMRSLAYQDEASGCLPSRLGFCTGVGTWGALKGKPGRWNRAGPAEVDIVGQAETLGSSCSGLALSLRIPGEFSGRLLASPVGGLRSQSTPGNATDWGYVGCLQRLRTEVAFQSLGRSFCLVCFLFGLVFVALFSLLFVFPYMSSDYV